MVGGQPSVTKCSVWTIWTLACVLGLALPAAAVQVTLTSGRDNTLYAAGGDLSNGQGEHFFAGRSGSDGGLATLRSVLAFDIAAALPGNARIDAVTLTLTPTTPRFRAGGTLSLHRLQRAFGEGSSIASMGGAGGGVASPGDATWTAAVLGTDLWSTPGGDFDAAALATASAPFDPVVLTSALLVADVQQALDAPSQHFGWLLKLTDEALAAIRYGSFQSTTGSGPKLTIDYTVVPEPASASLLGLGLLALVARRRR
jgi:hypothetical protein